MKKGFFITFEGAEGSGKTTQIQRAAEHLRKKGYSILLLREPGGTRVSEKIREILLNKDLTEMKPETELLLYLAARAQIVRETIIPALAEGKVVICDRYEDSTLAYQGFGRKLPLKTIESVSASLVRGKIVPKLTFLLNIDPKKGMKRGGRHDRIERESYAFHGRVQKGFLKLAARNPKRYKVFDSTQDIETVSRQIAEVLDRVF
jgi:dTMP kinase